jgi:hypothetical protein
MKDETDTFAVIKVEREFIPEGAELVEAYLTDKELIVIGEPPQDDSHDCDAMGCSTFSHVIYRIDR